MNITALFRRFPSMLVKGEEYCTLHLMWLRCVCSLLLWLHNPFDMAYAATTQSPTWSYELRSRAMHCTIIMTNKEIHCPNAESEPLLGRGLKTVYATTQLGVMRSCELIQIAADILPIYKSQNSLCSLMSWATRDVEVVTSSKKRPDNLYWNV